MDNTAIDSDLQQQIEQIIKYKFKDPTLLSQAFTHSSAADDRLGSNERLEFLGDAVLALVICRNIYQRFPEYLEGDLTKIKSSLVSRRTCSAVAKRLGLHKFLKVGKGMMGNRALSGSLAAGLLEALIAVLYLDGGFDAAERFIIDSFAPYIERASSKFSQDNFKSTLQQYAQQQLGATPVYILLDEKGPDHDKCFESQVVIGDRRFPSAWGPSKKQAEQKAAFNALVELGLISGSFPEAD